MNGAGYTVGLAAWNVVVNRILPERHYVPANLAMTAVSYLFGRAAGASDGQLGTTRQAAVASTSRSLGAALAVAGGAVVASRLRATRALFDDARAHPDDVAYQTLVRIPLGTVALEELAFRGTLPWLIDGPQRSRPSLRSAALFGLWHILPTLRTLDINEIRQRHTRIAAVVAGVAVTGAVGLALDLVRLRLGSLLPPAVIHWSANASGYYIAAKRSQIATPN